MVPSVDDVLSQLSGAKAFSKLEANFGFYQIEPTPESAPRNRLGGSAITGYSSE